MQPIYTLFLLLASCGLQGQNTYHAVTNINTEASWLMSDLAAGTSVGTSLLIYQHGGASVALAGASPGQVTALNGAGWYDLNRVSRVSGDTVFLALPLRHTYAPSFTQVVTYRTADEVTINDALQVSQPFDGRLGGILFVAARDSLSLTSGASLSADHAGFRGGAGTEAASDCNRFTQANGETYPGGNWRGASRGEGIARTPGGQEFGRAPLANGGGGGNDHNAGGGGGANVSAGGEGARNVVMGLLNNACRGNFPGRAGRGLSPNEERLFFGGGGGAGHANNTTAARGGNGGGLIVLWSPVVSFAPGASLSARGEHPAVINGDGGGGGGAGGTVVLVAGQLSGRPTINASGGKGADVSNFADRCFGPGGGGSGGRLLTLAERLDNFDPEVDLSPGGFGLRLNSDACAPSDEPGGTGVVGRRQNLDLSLPFAGLSQTADTLCGAGTLRINDLSSGAERVSIEVSPASDAISLTDIGTDLAVTFDGSVAGTFRVVQTLFVEDRVYPGDTLSFSVFPVPAVDEVRVAAADEVVNVSLIGLAFSNGIRYDFGDGTVVDTNVTSLRHTYTSGGDYLVVITLLDGVCGNQEVWRQLNTIPTFAEADIDVKGAEGCTPFVLTVRDASQGTYTGRRWEFPGATTDSLSGNTATVTYEEPGVYTATLLLLEAVGNDTIDSVEVRVFAQPVADFSAEVDTATAAFTNLSLNGGRYEWSFGDGNGSADSTPVHRYEQTGTYPVRLIVGNGPCRDTIVRDVTIEVLSSLPELTRLGVRLYPNPTNGKIFVSGPATIGNVYDLRGRVVLRGNGPDADLSDLPAGQYVVGLRAGGRRYSVLVVR